MNNQKQKKTDTSEKAANQTKILALGDSYTFGEGVGSSQCWPAQLKNRLISKSYSVEEPTILAQTGWTTGDLLAAIAEISPDGLFDLITLLIGVNNQYQRGDIKTYQVEFNQLIEYAINFAGFTPQKVLVFSIPDWGKTRFEKERDPIQISAEIDQFNAINKRESMAVGCRYLDITELSRQSADDPSMLATDGLHPSGKMYSIWVKRMLPIVLQILQLN